MSTESIKHLLFRTEPEEVRKYPMYRSKFSKQVREEVKRVKDCHRTFGLPREMLTPKPLKKGTRKVIRPDIDKPKISVPQKMQVPRRDEWGAPLQREQPNFLLRNVIRAARMKPPQGPSRAFDSASGRRVHACNLLIPKFVLREDFGRVPRYLSKVKHKAEEEKKLREEEKLEREKEEKSAPGVELVSEEERERLIQGLKKAWEEQMKQYKLLPLVVDSTPMIKKKRNLEANLERIEKNIDLLERNRYIYVYNNKGICCQE